MDRALFSILTTLNTYGKSKQKHFAEKSDHLRLAKATIVRPLKVIRVVSLRRDVRCFPLFVFHFKKHFASCGACKYVCREPFCSLEKKISVYIHCCINQKLFDGEDAADRWTVLKKTRFETSETETGIAKCPSLLAYRAYICLCNVQPMHKYTWLVVSTILKNDGVRQWEGYDYPIYEMENKECSKPPTSYKYYKPTVLKHQADTIKVPIYMGPKSSCRT